MRPDCPEWIAAEGEITPATAAAFRAFLDRMDGRRRPLVINSAGGSVEAAVAMGRLIRARKLAVAVGATRLFAAPPAVTVRAPRLGAASSFPAVCASACTLVLAAGVERYASPLALVGVHEVKQRQSRTFVLRRMLVRYRIVDGRKQEISRQLVSEDRDTVTTTDVNPADVNQRLGAYLTQMGVDAKLIAIMQTATPDQIHRLTPDEERTTRLVTIWIDNSSAMGAKPLLNGLLGVAADPASGAQAALVADETWALKDGGEASGGRSFAAHFELRRGGGGVAAILTLLAGPGAPIRFGVAPGARDAKALPSPDAGVTTTFLPDEAFCRLVRFGDVFVALEPLPHPPTHAPGLPDPRRPPLLTPVSSVHGISALADEICLH